MEQQIKCGDCPHMYSELKRYRTDYQCLENWKNKMDLTKMDVFVKRPVLCPLIKGDEDE